jgi:uncharacterized protein YkwD
MTTSMPLRPWVEGDDARLEKLGQARPWFCRYSYGREENQMKVAPFTTCLNVVLIAGSLYAPGFQTPKSGSKIEASETERTLLELTNNARKKENLPLLKFNTTLLKVAREHSANMATQKEMKHELDGKKPSDRLKAAGYRYSRMGENIALGDRQPLETVFRGWMESPGHRANILNKDFEEIGIGVARDNRGRIYYTQVFGTPRKRGR